MEKSFDEWPELAEAFWYYTQCRKQEIIRIEKTKGSGKGQTTEVLLLPRPSGYSTLPWEGGLLDQPHRMFVFFDIFQAAESEIFAEKAR